MTLSSLIERLERDFGKVEADQLRRLYRGENIASSDRAEDRARTRLKKHGLISFDRETWKWTLTATGAHALRAREGHDEEN